MTVEFDAGSVVDAVVREEGDVWVHLRSPSGPRVAVVLADVVVELNLAHEPDGIYAELVSLSPEGAAAMLSIPDVDDVAAWMRDLARRLEARDVDGSLLAARPVDPPAWLGISPRPPSVAAFLAWSVDRGPAGADDDRRCAWGVSRPATERICAASARWGAVGGEQVRAGGSFPVDVADPATTVDIMVDGADIEGRVAALWHHPQPRRGRQVALGPGGEGVAEILPADVPWPHRVDALRRMLVVAPELLDVGFVRAVRAPASSWHQVALLLALPHVAEVDVRENRHLLDRWVPDACGVQVLTDAHLERAHDLSDWSVTDLGSGRHLVEAPDLEPWFAGELPDPGALQRGRADFGAMLLTRDVIDANPLPPPPG